MSSSSSVTPPPGAAPSTAGLSGYGEHFAEPTGYLDFGRFGPPSRDVLDTTQRLMEQSAHAGSDTVDELMRQELRARQAAARLLGGVDVDAVALLPNASTGLFHAAFGLPHGTVLVPAREFPSNAYPWLRAARLGRVQPVSLEPDGFGRITPELVRQALTPETVAVSLSAVDYRTGYRADLAGIREVIGPDRLLIVDAMQGMGVVDLPWSAADLLVTGGQKWLRAGWATGFLYASDRALERLEPTLTGWTGVVDAGVFDSQEHAVAPGAGRFSLTNLSPITAGALAAALELVEQAGVGRIQAHIAQRTAELIDTVRSAGGVVLSPEAEQERAGIVAFAMPRTQAPLVGEHLAKHGVVVTTRPDQLRFSAHASTTLATVDLVHRALTSLPV
ncbi:aminotransferase class V-fold PLP-dependent enzyme [Streptacidiphilus fuscans]|uniref:Aminotransferase class V-fold PLP-dependent enzyme n=1 Tax=Streptacidiphilus fuscans TaxID=2789292 RepID=A0A931BA77_9ACTN|nr:aminotransferase class V-fold PLP-dependent enzyme [Streptacidiphilus fuscans]MBF9072412.1 aminotransferase class V-fold PLP-dependent enzyme [Streptacidiphilus fuscans]